MRCFDEIFSSNWILVILNVDDLFATFITSTCFPLSILNRRKACKNAKINALNALKKPVCNAWCKSARAGLPEKKGRSSNGGQQNCHKNFEFLAGKYFNSFYCFINRTKNLQNSLWIVIWQNANIWAECITNRQGLKYIPSLWPFENLGTCQGFFQNLVQCQSLTCYSIKSPGWDTSTGSPLPDTIVRTCGRIFELIRYVWDQCARGWLYFSVRTKNSC